MKKIKMIGLDLDGTLLNDKKELTSHTREILTRAIDQGGNSAGCNRASGDRDPGSAPEFPGDAVRTDIERRKDPGFTGRQSTLCQYALL